MCLKKNIYKLYFRLICFSLIFFFILTNYSFSAVLTEEDIKYIESQTEDDDESEEGYIQYEDIKKKKKNTPFIFFNKSKKKKKKKKKENQFTEKEIIKSDKLKIGVLLPLTGKYSYIGQSLLDTMQLVIYENKDINSELFIKDTKANPSLAKKATKELVNEGVDVILGPFFSRSLKESFKIAKYKNIPIISFSNDFHVKDRGVYVMGFEPEKQINKITEYTIKKKYTRFAALLPNTKYGKRVLNTYRKTLKKNKLEISKVELYDFNTTNIEKNIQNLVGLDKNPQIEIDEETGENPIEKFDPGFDVLLLIETGNLLSETVALLTYYGVDFAKVKLIGTGEWYVDNIGAEPGLLGAWFVAPNPKLWKNFNKKFFKIYNYEPIRLSSLAHDSLKSIIEIISKNDNLYELNYNDFESTYGFTGIDGDFKFLSDGTVERKLSILEIKEKSFKVEKLAKKKNF